jgi:CHAT domain-containing protein/tetratricopeptide (TPR) repeat protein
VTIQGVAIAVAIALGAASAVTRADPVADSAAVLRERLRSDPPGAEQRARIWLAGLESAHAPDSAIANATDVLVEAMLENGSWGDDAIALARRAARAQSAVHGDTSVAAGSSLVTLGRLYYRRDELETARVVTEDGLARCERSPPPRGRSVYRGYRYLANIEDELADFGPAERCYRRSVAEAESLYGTSGAEYGNALNSFGSFCRRTGRDTDARDLYERALAIRAEALGPDDAGLVFNLNNLANLLGEIGDPVTARALFERGLGIATRAMGPSHPTVLLLLNNLADVDLALGDTTRAVEHYRRVIAIADSTGGPRRSEVAQCHNNLAQVELARGDTARARADLTAGLAIRMAIFGRDHPETASSLLQWAVLADAEGDPTRAAALDSEAVAILERHLGPDAMEVAAARVALGASRRRLGRADLAMEDAARAERIATGHVRVVMRALEERFALRYALTRPSGLDLALTLAAEHPDDHVMTRRAWDLVVHSRALVLDEMAGRHHTVVTSADPATRSLADSLATAGETLARLLAGGGVEDSLGRARVAMLRSERDRLEHALATRSARFRSDVQREDAGFDAVRGTLGPGTVLIAFTRYTRLADHPGHHGNTGPAYLAFALTGGDTLPVVVPLGAADTLDHLVSAWLGTLEQRPAPFDAGVETRSRALGTRVRARLWDPLRGLTESARIVLLVPDGALQRVPFAALPAAVGGYVVERGPPTQVLSAERDLVTRQPSALGHGMLAIGGPEFDTTPGTPGVTRGRSAGSACEAFRSLRFDPLPGARAEAESVAAAWRRHASDHETRLMTGAETRERAVRGALAGPRAIHLATHGFFIGAGCVVRDRLDSLALEDPLLRTGIALAGANHRAGAAHGDDDGILTAAEIATLDLEGVEWVTLSACQGAQGEIQDGEGVLGLRRGFAIAGVRTLVSSLWSVDDRATERWMIAWYEARLAHGKSVAESTREAQRVILATRRAAGESDHPYFWAAFLAAGDWR